MTTLEDPVTPPTGGVMVLCAGKDVPAQLAWTEDGGGRWSAVDGPGLPSDGEMSLAYGDGYVAVACDADVAGPFLSSDAGKTWARVPGLPPTGPIALVKEEGGLSLYAAHFFGPGTAARVIAGCGDRVFHLRYVHAVDPVAGNAGAGPRRI